MSAPATPHPAAVSPCSEPDDTQLLRGVLDGDPSAWRQFYRRFNPVITATVVRVLTRYRGRFAGAELGDMVSEVWVALLANDRRKLRIYDGERCRLATWLKLLASNATVDRLRVSDTHRATHDLGQLLAMADDGPRPDDEVLRRERAELVRRALSQLRADDRQFVAAYLSERHQTRELARDLGISINTVHSRKFKIRQKLVGLLRHVDGAPRRQPVAA